MIHEVICAYEVAKLAKEKGFGEMASCYQGYRKDGTLFYFSNMPDGKERIMQTDCLAPTQSLLQRWLREEKEIIIELKYSDSTESFRPFWSWQIYNSLGITLEIGEPNTTYEQCLEDALKYALENLV